VNVPWEYDFQDYERDLARIRAAEHRRAMIRARRERARNERKPVQAGPPKPRQQHDAHVRAAVARVINAAIRTRGRTAVAKHLGLSRSALVHALATGVNLRDRVRVNGLPK
jgi:transcriptional regulator with PAS, ATPase and Fis domain